MSNVNEATRAPKVQSWMFLVAAFVVLAVIGVLTS